MYEVYYRKHAGFGTMHWCRVPGEFKYEEARSIARGMVRHADVTEANVVRVVETFIATARETRAHA